MRRKSSEMERGAAFAWDKAWAVTLGAAENTTYRWAKVLVSVLMMLSVSGSHVQRPLSPLTDTGAKGAGRYGLVNSPALMDVTALTISPWTEYPASIRSAPARREPARSSGAQVSPSRWSMVTERRYKGPLELVA